MPPSERTNTPVRDPADVSVSDHVQSRSDDDYPEGVYRVVGRSADAVTLLRVADPDGTRRHTGELVTVPTADLDDFVVADSPERERTPLGVLVSVSADASWSVRAFGQQLRAHPVPTALGGALVFVGLVGERLLPLPDPVQSGLLLLGCLVLVSVGSGRLS
jgi:hypothetical protein